MRLARLTIFLLILVGLALPGGAEAEPRGVHWTLSGVGTYGIFNSDTYLKNSPGAGARVGLMANEYFGIEGAFGYLWADFDEAIYPGPDQSAHVKHYGADFLINFIPTGPVNPFIFGGWAQINVRPAVWGDHPEYSVDDRHFNGWEAGGGLKFKLWGGGVHRGLLRVEARDIYSKWDSFGGTDDEWKHTFLVSAGLTVDLGMDSDKDSDGDGVLDRDDRCKDTPLGARVDAFGCPMDSDGDGVYDGIDQCPGTPNKAKVDATGCPIDSDGDGIPDGIDKCPDTPTGAQVDAFGCPIDSDGDGVPDGIDQCPNTPMGAIIDSRGCPIDSDGDGVPDGIDQCPDTPANTQVDPRGCPMTEEARILLDTGTLVLRDIQFEVNSAQLKTTSFPALEKVGTILAQWPDLKLEVGGHTDSSGDAEYNRELSLKRAQSVADYIRDTYPTITDDQMEVKGYGEEQPIATNETREGKAKNRRVEFKVLNPGVFEQK